MITRYRRKFITSKAVSYIIRKSKKILLPGFQGLPLFDVVTFFFKQMRKVGLDERAAAISFNFLMALPPATIFLCTLIPYLPISTLVVEELLVLTEQLSPNQNTYYLIKNFLEDFLTTQRGGLLSFGIILAIYYSSNAVMGVMYSFNRSLLYQSKRGFFTDRWMAIKLTTVLIMMIIATIILLVTQGTIAQNLMDWLNIKSPFIRKLIGLIRWVVIVALFYYSIAVVYKYAPAVHKRWRLTSPGTLLATTLIILATVGFSYFVNNFATYNKVYGSIGTILIIMLLIYINSLVLLIGYELNVSIHSLKIMAHERARLEEKQEKSSEN